MLLQSYSGGASVSGVTLIWSGLDDRSKRSRFLASTVRWCQLEVGIRSPYRPGALASRTDTWAVGDLPSRRLELELEVLMAAGRNVMLELQQGEELLARVLEVLRVMRIAESRLAFRATPRVLGESAHRKLADLFPGSVRCLSVNSLAGELARGERPAVAALEAYSAWGASRFSLSGR